MCKTSYTTAAVSIHVPGTNIIPLLILSQTYSYNTYTGAIQETLRRKRVQAGKAASTFSAVYKIIARLRVLVSYVRTKRERLLRTAAVRSQLYSYVLTFDELVMHVCTYVRLLRVSVNAYVRTTSTSTSLVRRSAVSCTDSCTYVLNNQ